MMNVSVPAGDAGLVESPVIAPGLAESEASIDAYLTAGDRMATLMAVVWRSCVVLLVLVALGWGLGLLPGAVKLV